MTFWIVKLTDPAPQEAPAPGIPALFLADPCFFQVDADTPDEAITVAVDAFGGAYAQATAALDEHNNDSPITTREEP
jgi:hypothetical protein